MFEKNIILLSPPAKVVVPNNDLFLNHIGRKPKEISYDKIKFSIYSPFLFDKSNKIFIKEIGKAILNSGCVDISMTTTKDMKSIYEYSFNIAGSKLATEERLKLSNKIDSLQNELTKTNDSLSYIIDRIGNKTVYELSKILITIIWKKIIKESEHSIYQYKINKL